MESNLNTNAIAFIGLCNEYCVEVENARESERGEFIDHILRLLPRIYIAASDLKAESSGYEEPYIENILEEDYYEALRRNMEELMGADDVYLEEIGRASCRERV